MNEYQEKLKSLGFDLKKNPTKTTPVPAESERRTAGYHVEHKDGRVDATAYPKPGRTKVGVDGEVIHE